MNVPLSTSFPIYREANSYSHLMDPGIAGNPEGWKAEELHAQAWKIVEPHFLKAQEDALGAYEGQIDTLFVAAGIQHWGFYDLGTRTVHLHPDAEPGDEDLLDFAAVHTFLNRGTVYPMKPEDVPEGGAVAGIFRY